MRGILDIAMAMFEEHDFDDVTMAEIARRAGVRSATIYWYFESKDHLLAAVVNRVNELSVERLDAHPRSASAAEHLMRHLTGLQHTRPIHASAHARVRLSTAVAEAHASSMDYLRELIVAALHDHPAPDQEMLTALILALFEGTHDPGYHGPTATELVAYALKRVASTP